MQDLKNKLFIPAREELEKDLEIENTPFFFTSEKILKRDFKRINDVFSKVGGKVFYAVKANYNPAILKSLKSAGLSGLDTVSPNEIRLAKELGFDVVYTPSFASREELEFALESGAYLNLGSISELEELVENFEPTEISLRVSPGISAGENDKIKTGGDDSKFGIEKEKLSLARELAEKKGFKITGLHMHIGSGFYDPDTFAEAVRVLTILAKDFQDLKILDLGGGFGVSYRPEDKEIDLESFVQKASPYIEALENHLGRKVELRIEPGKYIVSRSTSLIVKATHIKEKIANLFVGVDSGFNHLIRPAMYGAYHHVVNLSALHRGETEKVKAKIAGYICETGDVFSELEILRPQKGDYLAILSAGAYGSSMSSYYNMRETAPDLMLKENGAVALTKKRASYGDIVNLFCDL